MDVGLEQCCDSACVPLISDQIPESAGRSHQRVLGWLAGWLSQVVLDCCEGGSQREAMDNLLRKGDEEKTLKAESLLKLLGAVKASFPGLHLLLDNLVATENVSDGKGMGILDLGAPFRELPGSSDACLDFSVLV